MKLRNDGSEAAIVKKKITVFMYITIKKVKITFKSSGYYFSINNSFYIFIYAYSF